VLFLTESKTASALSPTARIATGQLLRGWLEVARNKGALIVSFVQACQYYIYGVVEFYLVQYMIQVAAFNALQYGFVMGIQIVSLIVSRPVMGRFSDRTSRRIPVVLGCVLSGVLLFFIPFTTSFVLLSLISIGYGLGFAMVISSTSPLMVELTPSAIVGTSMGFLSTMMDVGQVLGPIITGIILTPVLQNVIPALFQYKEAFGSLTALLAVSAAVFFLASIARTKKMGKEKSDQPFLGNLSDQPIQ
jgi:MFS family permease